MEKSNNYVLFGVLALVVSLVAVSLAYAGFTATLNISGSGTVVNAKWDVHFANLALDENTGVTVNTAPSIKGTDTTIIEGLDVSFTTPNTSISYTFDVENRGTFDAKLSGLTIGAPSCSGDPKAATVCDYITYKLYDTTTNTELTAADNAKLVAVSGTRHFKLVVSYGNIPSEDLPTNNVNVSGLTVAFNYTQDGSNTNGE